jgi:hypothetical protein
MHTTILRQMGSILSWQTLCSCDDPLLVVVRGGSKRLAHLSGLLRSTLLVAAQ